METRDTTRNYIGGQWVPAKEQMQVFSPSSGKLVSTAPLSREDDVNKATANAKAAFVSWSKKTVEERSTIVRGLATWLKDQYGNAGDATELKSLIINSVGKPLAEADIEVIETAGFVDYFCDVAPQTLSSKKVQLSQELWPTKESIVFYEPVGVVGVIKPWNYPLELPTWATVPALLAGNTVVLKPSEKSSTVGLLFGQMAEAAGLPSGVLNVVSGDKQTGRLIVEHPDINMVSFTGSVSAGKWIAEACARQLKKVTLELGGNDAAIVLDDVDLELAANGLVWGAFCNAGQVCVGIKRAFIPKRISEQLLPMIVENTRSLRLGVDVGPIIDEKQRGEVERFVKDAVDKGAKVLTGGKRASLQGGIYFEPTVLVDINKSMALANEECFGPVLPIQVVDNEHEAISLANDSTYGLGASIWTGNESRGMTLARDLRAGMVWINDVNVAFAETPWGGTKMSGQGFELSPECLLEYVVRKHVSIEKSSDTRRFWWYPYE